MFTGITRIYQVFFYSATFTFKKHKQSLKILVRQVYKSHPGVIYLLIHNKTSLLQEKIKPLNKLSLFALLPKLLMDTGSMYRIYKLSSVHCLSSLLSPSQTRYFIQKKVFFFLLQLFLCQEKVKNLGHCVHSFLHSIVSRQKREEKEHKHNWIYCLVANLIYIAKQSCISIEIRRYFTPDNFHLCNRSSDKLQCFTESLCESSDYSYSP